LFVVLGQVILDGDNEFFNTSEVAPAQALLGEFSKPTLDQVKPERTGGRVMNMKALMFRQSLRNVVMFMSAVIVHDQMQVQAGRHLAIELAATHASAGAIGCPRRRALLIAWAHRSHI
jgi:hypothetical protein